MIEFLTIVAAATSCFSAVGVGLLLKHKAGPPAAVETDNITVDSDHEGLV